MPSSGCPRAAQESRPTSSSRAAAVQLNHLSGDKETNLGKIQEFVRKAADEGVELLAFPEMCISGYWHMRNFPREAVEELAEPFLGGPSTRRLVDLTVVELGYEVVR